MFSYDLTPSWQNDHSCPSVVHFQHFSRNRRHVGTGKNRHRRNDDSLPRYSFKIHKDAMDENGKAGVSARSFLNIQKEDKKMIRSLTQAGGRRYIQLKKMVSFFFEKKYSILLKLTI